MIKHLSLAVFLLFSTAFISAQVQFRIVGMPANTPANDTIFIAGSFNGWNPRNVQYALFPDSLGVRSITLPAGTGTIQFKFTRGSWPKGETQANGAQLPNRTFTYGNGQTVNITIANWEDLTNPGNPSTANQNVSVLSTNFFMPQLNRSRRIWLYLPNDYATTTKTYPVIYLQDGQNLFDNLTAFSGEWEVDETLRAKQLQGDSGVIVVGIDNGGGQRINEYSPWVNAQYGGGQGNLYMDFIVQTLKPHIDSLYRTKPDRLNTAIGGSSMGGLISLYGTLQHQSVFGKALIFSPSLWFSPALWPFIAQQGRTQDFKLYLLAGGQESANMVTQMNQLYQDLLAAGFSPAELNLVIKADGQHSEWFWKREFGAGYDWLFNNVGTSTTDEVKKGGIKIYPNPFMDQVIFKDEAKKYNSLSVLNSVGQLVHYQGLNGSDSLSLGHLAPGIYMMKFSNANETYVRKMVKSE